MRVPPSCQMVRLPEHAVGQFGPGRYALLAPVAVAPQSGDVVAFHGPDGLNLRRYQITHGTGGTFVVLQQAQRERLPAVYPPDKVPNDLRVVLMTGRAQPAAKRSMNTRPPPVVSSPRREKVPPED